jgi:hypothetical protein
MALDIPDFTNRLVNRKLSDSRFSAGVAIGVRDHPIKGQTSWIVYTIANGMVNHVNNAELPSTALADVDFEVSVAISAREEVWERIMSVGRDAFLEAVRRTQFFVLGDAPFFIRHLDTFDEFLAAIYP